MTRQGYSKVFLNSPASSCSLSNIRRDIDLNQVLLDIPGGKFEFVQGIQCCAVFGPGETPIQDWVVNCFPGGEVLIHEADWSVGTKLFGDPAQDLACS